MAFPITPQCQMGKKQLHVIREPNLVLLALPNSDTAPCLRDPPRPGAKPTVLRFRDSLGPSGALWTVPNKSSPRRKRSKSPAPLRGHSRNTLANSRRPPATTLEAPVSVRRELLPEGTVGAIRAQASQVNGWRCRAQPPSHLPEPPVP